MAFVRRILTATFQLGQGSFGTEGFNTVTVSGLRMSANIEQAGGQEMGVLHLRIWGMNLSLMNKLATLGQKIINGKLNVVTVSAGNEGETPGLVFKGTIRDAYADFNSAPDVSFEVIAQSSWFESVTPAQPISIRGSADVATMLSGIANQMRLRFENNGVTAKLSRSYYAGSLRNQALKIVGDAGILWNEGNDGILAIWPKGGSRGGVIPLISPQTGMINYPTFSSLGIIVRTIYNPSIIFGGRVKVETVIEPAKGTWQVNKLSHSLDALIPNGRWETTVILAEVGFVVVAGR